MIESYLRDEGDMNIELEQMIMYLETFKIASETTDRGTWLQHQGLGYAHRQHQGIVGWHRSRAGGIDDGYSARP